MFTIITWHLISTGLVFGATNPTIDTSNVNLSDTLTHLCDIGAGLAGGLAALGFLRAGILWIANGDSPQHENRARSAFVASCIGLVICLAAVTLANLVAGAVQ